MTGQIDYAEEIIGDQVLSAILADPENLDAVAEIADPQDFPRGDQREALAAMLGLRHKGDPIDSGTIYNPLRLGGKVSNPVATIKRIQGAEPCLNVVFSAGLVRQRAVLRRLKAEAYRILQAVDERPESALDEALQAIRGIEDRRGGSTFVPLREGLQKGLGRLEALARGEGRRGIRTGFAKFDTMTGGFHPGALIIGGGRPGGGKSAFAGTCATNAAAMRQHVMIFSAEMPLDENIDRVIAGHAKINLLRLRNGDLSSDDWQKVVEAADTLADLPIWIDDSAGLHVNEIIRRTRRAKRDHGVDIVFIDYLQLLNGDRHRNATGRVYEIEGITRALKCMAKDLDIPVVLLSQLNRAVEQRPDRKPTLADLRDSGAIEQDADVVFLLWPANPSDDGPSRTVNVTIAKNRHGPCGTLQLNFDARTTRFFD